MPILAPETIDLSGVLSAERELLFECRDLDGVLHLNHDDFEPTVYTETDDSNGPIIGNMCPRCGYWAGSLRWYAESGERPGRWPQ